MYSTTNMDAATLLCAASERKSSLKWRSRVERPACERILLFDFGTGVVVGEFNGTNFTSAERPGEWDPVLVDR
jgi:hypothetical protein